MTSYLERPARAHWLADALSVIVLAVLSAAVCVLTWRAW